MCGFSGFLGQGAWLNASEKILYAMCSRLSHRGPDDNGIWVNPDLGIGLAHTRLSILDLSPAGHQPMFSTSGRYVIVFNGEIYNHLKLREQLPNHKWRGHSDTETLLAGFEYWGVTETIQRTIGMFGFALWDSQQRQLTLGRDRAGEKPVYYGWCDGVFLFGSELKALVAHPVFNKKLDFDALSLFLKHSYVPAPYTIYTNIKKLLPGTLLIYSQDCKTTQEVSYWSAPQQLIQSDNFRVFEGDEQDAINELEQLVKDAVGQQMISDVPLGAFLSGGVDSSTIAALMQAQSSKPIQTFSIGFDEEQYNEAHYAKEIARHLGTHHSELYVSTQDALDVIPELPSLYDEPFADSSQIPTYLVAKLAKTQVTVALSGDAGDELFAGYSRYLSIANHWNKINKIPYPLRKLIASGVHSIPVQVWDTVARPIFKNTSRLGHKVHKAGHVCKSQSVDEAYHSMISHYDKPHLLLRQNLKNQTGSLQLSNNNLDSVSRMMFTDFKHYLPDDILVKVDRAAMGVSLETRVPFLDHRIVEFAWSLPLSMKIKDGKSKWLLREVLYRYVPKELIERPKMGFGIPLETWLRGPLKPWAESLLDKKRLHDEGVFNSNMVDSLWTTFCRKNSFGPLIWNILMFQMWQEKNSAVL